MATTIRFDTVGRRLGVPLDLNEVLPESLRQRNWEGLGWYEAGKRLVIVHDSPPPGIPTAYVIDVGRNTAVNTSHNAVGNAVGHQHRGRPPIAPAIDPTALPRLVRRSIARLP